MPAITLKNIPDPLYAQIKTAANAHRRSLNSEILYCVERTLGTHKINSSEHIEMARKLRTKTALHNLTDEELSDLKNKGRP
ncbi:MAG TPA: DNA-binding protein [Gammaproteobacteria bacterium]|jgi:plasmid stability protein|nr:DNA-binding protein [Gammaproteobacteria bacterium]